MPIRSRRLLPALGVWLLLLGFAVINGLFRRVVLEPQFGPDAAHVLATTTLAGAVFLAALLYIGAGRSRHSTAELVGIGVAWALLTAVLEIALGFVRGDPAGSLFRDYDVSRGRLFGLVILAELVSPLLAGWIRRAGESPAGTSGRS